MHWRLLLAKGVWLALLALAALSACRGGSATPTPRPDVTVSATATLVAPTLVAPHTATATLTARPAITATPAATTGAATTTLASPISTPSATSVPSATCTAPATSSATSPPALATATDTPAAASPAVTATYTRVLPPTATLPSAPPAGGAMIRITLAGDLDALRRDGVTLWEAVAVECFDPAGKLLGRTPLRDVSGEYRLPERTVRVRLWVGAALGGAAWWELWDSQAADVLSPDVVLEIRRIAAGPPPVPTATPLPPTDTPLPPPTPPPSPTRVPG